MTVYINNSALNNQPVDLREYLIQIQTDQTAILGNMTRNRIGQKKAAEMTFALLSPTDYQTMINYFTTGSGIYYYNDASDYTGNTLAMSGLPTFQEFEYVKGGSRYRAFQVSIREI